MLFRINNQVQNAFIKAFGISKVFDVIDGTVCIV